MRKRIFLFVLLVALGVASLSCGYTVKSSLPARLKTVHVELFKNSIDFSQASGRNLYFPMLETDIRNAVVDRFVIDGNLKIVPAESADLILQGELKNYERQTLRYTDNNDVYEYRVQITVALKMFDTENNELYWEEPSFVGEATYFVSGPLVSSEESALKEAEKDLARRIVERTIGDW